MPPLYDLIREGLLREAGCPAPGGPNHRRHRARAHSPLLHGRRIPPPSRSERGSGGRRCLDRREDRGHLRGVTGIEGRLLDLLTPGATQFAEVGLDPQPPAVSAGPEDPGRHPGTRCAGWAPRGRSGAEPRPHPFAAVLMAPVVGPYAAQVVMNVLRTASFSSASLGERTDRNHDSVPGSGRRWRAGAADG
jgi:hypothetical protein